MTRGLLCVLAVVLVGGCSGPASPAGPSGGAVRGVPDRALAASVAQFRSDEGTPHLRAGVVNDGHRDIRVSEATISWSGMAFSTAEPPGDPVHPGQASAFTVDQGRPRCGGPPPGRPVLVAVVDGHRRRLPLHVDQPGLLGRLRAAACAGVRLAGQATVRLRLAPATAGHGQREHLPGAVVLTRRPGSRTPVRVVDLGGSVLFELRSPRLPATLRSGAAGLRVPVAVWSANRCDPHSRSQSSQTFLFSVYVQVAGSAAHRVVTVPSSGEQVRLLAMLDRVCRA